MLSPTALSQYKLISQYLSRKWDENPALHSKLWEWNGCLEKLATSILQIDRLSNRQNQLLAQAIDNIVKGNANDVVFFLLARFHQILNASFAGSSCSRSVNKLHF